MASRGSGAKAKGASAEREVAKILQEHGYDSHRGMVCYHEPDIVGGVPGLHLEVKRQEQVRLTDWMAQSDAQKRAGEIPTVVHRKNREEWLITMKFEDFLEFIKLPFEE